MSTKEDPVLSGRFSFRDPMLFRARATLSGIQLILTGWHFGGRYNRVISVDEIVHADATGSHGLVLWLVDGEVIRLRIDNAEAWRQALTRKPDL